MLSPKACEPQASLLQQTGLLQTKQNQDSGATLRASHLHSHAYGWTQLLVLSPPGWGKEDWLTLLNELLSTLTPRGRYWTARLYITNNMGQK